MDVKRRNFLRLTGAGLCVLPLNIAGMRLARASQITELTLQPEQRSWHGDSEQPVSLWGTDQEVLRLQQHQPAEILVRNRLPQASSLHWHGLRIDNAMDGVSGLTQPPIEPGDTYTYRFTPKDAGTFWAHSHHNTFEQLARGLYLPMIVEESTPYPADQDLLLVLDDWLLNSNAQLDLKSLGNLQEWSHGGRMGNLLTVNRQITPRLQVHAGSRIRLRVLNTANSRIMTLALNGLNAWIIAKDGQPIATPLKLKNKLLLAPAERYDLVVDIPTDWRGEQPVNLISNRNTVTGAYWQVTEPEQNPLSRTPPEPLPANPISATGTSQADHHAELVMAGGAMGGLRNAVYKNVKMSARELILQKQIWAFNGVANLPEAPLLRARTGEIIEIDILNKTRWPHGMHLHGHHFQQSGSDRYAPDMWHDTLLMEKNEKVTIRFQAGLPGKWLLHCHMIEHQAAGMVTWLEITA